MLGRKVDLARTFRGRLWGLVGRSGWGETDGLWIEPCAGVHTFGMRFAIDVILVDEGLQVLWLGRHIRPWRLGKMHLDAQAALELPLGAVDKTGTTLGDLLTLELDDEEKRTEVDAL